MSRRQKIAIIGAGLAGLGAAHALRKRAMDAVVFEASANTGGRIARDEVDGFRIDLGAGFFMESDRTIQAVASELGVPLERTLLPINGRLLRNGTFHPFYGGSQPGNLWRTARTLLSFRYLGPGAVWQLLRFAAMLQKQASILNREDAASVAALDGAESAAAFIRSRFGDEFLEWFFAPNLTSYTFGQPEEVGTAYALGVLWSVAMNGTAWPVVPCGGPSVLVDALAAACAGSIRLATPAHRIAIEEGVVRGVQVDGGLVEADAVICATTAPAALRIMPDLPPGVRDTMRRVTYSRCLRVFFGVTTHPLPEDWYAAAMPRQTGSLLAGLGNPTVLSPGLAPEGMALLDALVVGERAAELSALGHQEAGDRVLAELRRLFPAMQREPLFTRICEWEEAVCLAPAGMMEAIQKIRLDLPQGVRGLFLAGEYMGIPSLNGALRSGINAAGRCAAFLSEAAPPGP